MNQVATGYRDTWLWNLGFSAYWFATTYKWFVVLMLVLPAQIDEVLRLEAIRELGLNEVDALAWATDHHEQRWALVFGIGAVWALIGPAIFGGLSDRLRSKWGHRQPFIAIGAALTAMAAVYLAGADEFWMLIVGYLFLQFSDDVGTGPYSAMVPEIVPESRRGRASSVMATLQMLGQLSAGVVAVVIIFKTGSVVAGIKPIYYGIALVNILCATATLITIRHVRAKEVAEEAKEPFWKRWARPFKSADFRWVWITRFINALGFYLVVQYLLFFLKDAYTTYELFGWTVIGEKPADQAGYATLILALTLALTGAIGALVASKYADKHGRKLFIYIAGVIVFCVLIPFAFVRDLTIAWLLSAGFGFGYGLYLSADWALVSDVIPSKDAAGTDMGVWQMSISSVQIIAALTGFTAISWANDEWVDKHYGYMGSIILAGALYLLSTVLIRNVRGSR